MATVLYIFPSIGDSTVPWISTAPTVFTTCIDTWLSLLNIILTEVTTVLTVYLFSTISFHLLGPRTRRIDIKKEER